MLKGNTWTISSAFIPAPVPLSNHISQLFFFFNGSIFKSPASLTIVHTWILSKDDQTHTRPPENGTLQMSIKALTINSTSIQDDRERDEVSLQSLWRKPNPKLNSDNITKWWFRGKSEPSQKPEMAIPLRYSVQMVGDAVTQPTCH